VEQDELTVAYGGARLPLSVVQEIFEELITGVSERLADEEQAKAQREIAERLDSVVISARPALPGEPVLSGEEARNAGRALILEESET
jgi:hypothetical protein